MDFLTTQKVSKGHGRLETRILTTSEMLNPYSTWPGLAQVYRLERQFQWRRSGRCYRTSNEVEFGITSLSRTNASPARLLRDCLISRSKPSSLSERVSGKLGI
jgi:hypothetical protein